MATDETQELADYIRSWSAEQNVFNVGSVLTDLAALHNDDLRLLAGAILDGGWHR